MSGGLSRWPAPTPAWALPWLLVLAVAGCTPEQDTAAQPEAAAAADRRVLVQAYDQDADRTRRRLATVLALHVGGLKAAPFPFRTNELASVDPSDPRRLRIGLGFRGAIPAQGHRRQAVRGEFRVYLHDQGVVVIEALCADDADRGERACAERDRLLGATELALQARLHDAGIEGLLPAGDCQVHVAQPVESGEAQVTTVDCAYPEGVMLALYRLDGEQGRALQASLLAALVADAEVP